VNKNIFDLQEEEEMYLRKKLDDRRTVDFRRFKVFIEYNTSFGFEIICNLLRDDGNEEKDVRSALLSRDMKTIYAVQVKHVTKQVITLIIIAGEEFLHPESQSMKTPVKSSHEDLSAIYQNYNDETADISQLQLNPKENIS